MGLPIFYDLLYSVYEKAKIKGDTLCPSMNFVVSIVAMSLNWSPSKRVIQLK